MNKLIILFASIWLVSCVDTVAERQGVMIEVVPVTYSVQVNVKKNNQKEAKQHLNEFVDLHWKVITSQPVKLEWTTPVGKKLADEYKAYLISLGVGQEQLAVIKSPHNAGEKVFDMKLSTTKHRAVAPLCDYYKVGHLGRLSDGCFSESNRWLSIANPEQHLTGKQ